MHHRKMYKVPHLVGHILLGRRLASTEGAAQSEVVSPDGRKSRGTHSVGSGCPLSIRYPLPIARWPRALALRSYKTAHEMWLVRRRVAVYRTFGDTGRFILRVVFGLCRDIDIVLRLLTAFCVSHYSHVQRVCKRDAAVYGS